MIDRLKNHILLNKNIYILSSFLTLSFLIMSYFSLSYIPIWWDEAVYIGMGKYIATSGNIGMWEPFRPPLLPLVYALLFKMNVPLIFAGKLIVIISSLGSLFFAYKIGESIKKGSGIFSSIFLFITPVFFYFSKIPTTDIISMFFVLFSIYLFNKDKFFLSGLVASLIFLLRFPQGLIIFCFGLIIIIDTYNNQYKIWLKNCIYRGLIMSLGFMLLVIPYFVSNYFLYGNSLEPLILGNQIVSWSSKYYDFGLFYYAKEIFRTAPFLYFAVLTPILCWRKDFFVDLQSKKNYRRLVLILIIFASYFFWQTHKELRYSLAFVPYLAILSGVFFFYLLNISKKIYYVLLSVFFVGILFMVYNSWPLLIDSGDRNHLQVNNFLETLSGNYLSTTPTPSALGKTRVFSIFETASDFNDSFNGSKGKIDGVILKECDIYCPEKTSENLCTKDLSNIHKEIESSLFDVVYKGEVDKCKIIIYKKQTL